MSGTRLGTRSTSLPLRKTPKATEWWEYWEPEPPLIGSPPDVQDAPEPTNSSLLGPDGKPIPYASKKQGFAGFTVLKERP